MSSRPGGLGRRERVDRSRARAWALQVHYRWESAGERGSLRDALVETVGTRRVAHRRLPFIRSILDRLDAHLPEVDRAIQGALENWRFDRLARIDRAVLRIGAAELLYGDQDVPPRVAIHEAIRLAEAYGGQDSPRFVNGVLDALYKQRIAGGPRDRNGGDTPDGEGGPARRNRDDVPGGEAR